MSNDAQEGGDKISTVVQLGLMFTGVGEAAVASDVAKVGKGAEALTDSAKGLATVEDAAKAGAETGKVEDAARAAEEVSPPGDGVQITKRKLTDEEKLRYSRAKFRKGVKAKAWENAKAESLDGVVRDPVSNAEMKPDAPWDMGHKPGYENWKAQQWAADQGLTREEWIDHYNDPSHYRPELPLSNSTHAGEDASGLFLGDW
jgi:hypothetical protein